MSQDRRDNQALKLLNSDTSKLVSDLVIESKKIDCDDEDEDEDALSSRFYEVNNQLMDELESYLALHR